MKFQVLDWYTEDKLFSKDDFLDDNDKYNTDYTIYMFGVTEDQESITVKVKDYHPVIFIKIPDTWEKNHVLIRKLIEYIKRKSWPNSKTGILSYSIVKRKKYYGFENGKISTFVRLKFRNQATMKRCLYLFKFPIKVDDYQRIPIKFDLYEGNIDPVLRFCHQTDILMAGWISIEKFSLNKDENSTFTKHNIECNWKNVTHYSSDKIAKGIKALYWDIECTSGSGEFPNPEIGCDKVIQIGNVTEKIGSKEPPVKVLFNLGTCDPIKDTIVHCFDNEQDLILGWTKYLQESDPDIICGYNIFGFDLWYLYKRSEYLNITEEFSQLSKLRDYYSPLVPKKIDNQQVGYNDLNMVPTPGRLQIDLLQIVKKEHKLTSYKLDNVAEHFLGDKKHDVTPQEIFASFKLGPAERARVGDYCIQDSDLCRRLLTKLCVLPNLIEMAKVTKVPIEYLITRGQQIKVFSQIAYETRKHNFLIPNDPGIESDDSKFKGATVLTANTGAYYRPVVGLDFASLYPSIMIAHNMCYSTIVLDKEYSDIPGVEYSTIEWTEESENGEDPIEYSYKFVQNQEGILSEILQTLWKERKATKALMKVEQDPFQKAVYNGKQLAIKVSMNSIYGFAGASKGFLPCREISSSVTGCGRQMIQQTVDLAKRDFNCEIVYGDTDSCYVIFPEKPNSETDLTNIFDISEKAAKSISATFKKPIELEFEKVMFPFLLFAKKRYIYLEWTNPLKHSDIEAKGVELVRRDNCPYVKTVLHDALQPIIYEKDTNKAVEIAKQHLRNVLENKIDYDQLVLSKTLKKTYKVHDKECPDIHKGPGWCRCMKFPHLQLQYKLFDRDPMSAPKAGDRVPYVFVETSNPKDLQCKKVEDPEFARENTLKIDSIYYIEHQLQQPLETLFGVLLNDTKVIFNEYLEIKKKDTKKKKQIIAQMNAKEKGNSFITQFYKVIK